MSKRGVSAVVRWIKNPALSPQWLWGPLRYGFDSWLGNYQMPWAGQKKKKKWAKDLNRHITKEDGE